MNNENLEMFSPGTCVITSVSSLYEAFAKWHDDILLAHKESDDKQIVSPKDAAKMLGVTVSTLNRWRKKKYLNSIKRGRINWYYVNEIKLIKNIK